LGNDDRHTLLTDRLMVVLYCCRRLKLSNANNPPINNPIPANILPLVNTFLGVGVAAVTVGWGRWTVRIELEGLAVKDSIILAFNARGGATWGKP
jgi:hypothetical protein